MNTITLLTVMLFVILVQCSENNPPNFDSIIDRILIKVQEQDKSNPFNGLANKTVYMYDAVRRIYDYVIVNESNHIGLASIMRADKSVGQVLSEKEKIYNISVNLKIPFTRIEGMVKYAYDWKPGQLRFTAEPKQSPVYQFHLIVNDVKKTSLAPIVVKPRIISNRTKDELYGPFVKCDSQTDDTICHDIAIFLYSPLSLGSIHKKIHCKLATLIRNVKDF